jgi:hypothetical protein
VHGGCVEDFKKLLNHASLTVLLSHESRIEIDIISHKPLQQVYLCSQFRLNSDEWFTMLTLESDRGIAFLADYVPPD